jgi:hypothetical protein
MSEGTGDWAFPRHPGTDGLKPSARATKPGTQRVPGGLIQATKVAFVIEAEGFSPSATPLTG